MALAQKKQIDIMNKAKEIEGKLLLKYTRMDPSLTFGGKVKYFQEKNNKNPFLIDALWSLVKSRNLIAHPGEFTISLKEYELFSANYEYVSKFLK